MGSDDEMEAPVLVTGMSPDVVSVHMQDIALEDVEAVTSGGMIDEYIADEEETSEARRAESVFSLEKEFLYDNENSSRSYKQFRSLVSSQEIVHLSQITLHLIELLEIGNTAKEAVNMRTQYKSRKPVLVYNEEKT